ncbi:hypothetical protein [uncultured Thioclava sp.]|uniref:hypothetical protein n=1 Tax=uncultured Thioclava sp. TaxID=473858 RepID=UPI0025EE88D5|nr:hypothetical protein [uncultured Thioclava sp.]
MFALFLAVTIALALLGWAELSPRPAGVKNTHAQTPASDAVTAPHMHRKRAKFELPRFKLPQFKLRFLKRAAKGQSDETLSHLTAPIVPLSELRETALEDAQSDAARTRPDRGAAAVPGDADAAVMARIAAMLDSPEAESDLAEDEADLPRITGFTLGDQIVLEMDGPAPHRNDIRFAPAQSGPHTIALIADEPILLIENIEAAQLTPEVVSFRAQAVA